MAIVMETMMPCYAMRLEEKAADDKSEGTKEGRKIENDDLQVVEYNVFNIFPVHGILHGFHYLLW